MQVNRSKDCSASPKKICEAAGDLGAFVVNHHVIERDSVPLDNGIKLLTICGKGTYKWYQSLLV